MAIKCSYKVFSRIEKNQFEKFLNECSEEYIYIDWLKIFYSFNRNPFFLLLNLLIFYIMIYCVKYVSQEFIAVSIHKIQKIFSISVVIASVFVLPLANGLPDLIVYLMTSQMEEGIKITTGAILGTGLLDLTIITAFIVYYSKSHTIDFDRIIFFKDHIFYGLILIIF